MTVPTGVNGNGRAGHNADGRGDRGKFATGNTFAAGNPLNKRAQQIRVALLEAVTPEEMGQAAKKLLGQAKDGDIRAFAELTDRTIGRPTTQDVVERLERLEATLASLALQRSVQCEG